METPDEHKHSNTLPQRATARPFPLADAHWTENWCCQCGKKNDREIVASHICGWNVVASYASNGAHCFFLPHCVCAKEHQTHMHYVRTRCNYSHAQIRVTSHEIKLEKTRLGTNLATPIAYKIDTERSYHKSAFVNDGISMSLLWASQAAEQRMWWEICQQRLN